ncbi:hypothetical protein PIB30_072318 [Stylosanthes scabra]|uniref:Uncharacterized protein n=1 Tax=Stylosanthes scabra TaxID=79078 RepID=A0ABU6RP87_9FABA|nr:hypothetical protein [Stylosanthes scabra]
MEECRGEVRGSDAWRVTALEERRVPLGRGATLVEGGDAAQTRNTGLGWAYKWVKGIVTSNMAGRGRRGGQLIRDPDINRLDESYHVAEAIGLQGCGTTGVASE